MLINKKVDELSDRMISAVQEIVKIKSVKSEQKAGMPFGEGSAAALISTLEVARDLGFKVVNLDNYVGYAECGEGDDYIGILGHLDVVPEGDGWKYDPYGAEIHDGKIFGRGTMDDKGPTISALFGLKAVIDAGLPLSKRVRVVFGADEETGSGIDIEHYLKNEKPPVAGFTPDASYPIINGEKGLTIFDLVKNLELKQQGETEIIYVKGGQRPNMVPDFCEAGIKTKLKSQLIESCEQFSERTAYNLKAEEKDDIVIVRAYGIGAHGSTPEKGKNAIMQLFAFLGELDLGKSDIADYINFFNKYVGMETDGESFGVGLKDEVSGKLSFNVGVADINETKAKLTLNLRYPVTFTYEDFIKPINERLDGSGISIEAMNAKAPLYFPKEHPLIKALQKVYTEQTNSEAELISIGGGTYAKEMPNIVGFGPIFPGEPDLDHQANECIEIKNLILNAKIYAHAIYELAK